MPKLKIILFCASLFVSFSSFAKEKKIKFENYLEAARLECLMARCGSVGKSKLVTCKLSDYSATNTESKDGTMGALRDVLCESPSSFCQQINAMSEEARLNQYATMDCSPLPKLGLFSNLNSIRDGRTDEQKSTYIDLIRKSWGCTEAKLKTSKTFTNISYDCDSDLLPIPCDELIKLQNTSPSPDNSDKSVREILVQVDQKTLSSRYLKFELSNKKNRCIVSVQVPKSELQKVEASQNEIISKVELALDYLESRVGDEDVRIRRLFKRSLTPERLKMLDEIFTAAKKSLLLKLKERNPPAPKDVVEKIENTKLVDYESLLKSGSEGLLSLRQAALSCASMNFFSAINGGPQPYTAFNASLAPFGEKGDDGSIRYNSYRMVVCPGALIDAEWSNPRFLIPVIEHEMNHALSPCLLGTEIAKSRQKGSCEIPVDAATQEKLRFLRSLQSYASCLYENSDMGVADSHEKCAKDISCHRSGPQVRKGSNQELVQKLNEFNSIINENKNISKLGGIGLLARKFGVAPECFINDMLPVSEGGRGLLMECQTTLSPLDGFIANTFEDDADEWISERKFDRAEGKQDSRDAIRDRNGLVIGSRSERKLKKLVEEISELVLSPRENQAEEAIADALASKAWLEGLRSTKFGKIGFEALSSDLKVQELLSGLAGFCQMRSVKDDSHPHPDFRVSLFAGNNEVRELLQCTAPASNKPLVEYPANTCEF